MERALRAMGHEDVRISWAGRTDAGVSAAGNVAVFDTHLPPASLLPGLSHAMEGVWTWAHAEVSAGFEPRHARRRHYRYFLPTEAAAEAVADAMRMFEGTHDFTGFSKLEPDVDPRRTVFATSARREGRAVVIDVEGESFVWNQVRRMVSAAARVAEGRVPRKEVEAALATGAAADFGTAEAAGLVLLDVEYSQVSFTRVDDPARALARLARRIEDAEREVKMLHTLRGRAEGR